MSDPPTPRPFYLAAGSTPVFAMLHPAAAPSRRSAVLMCSPFGWEDMCSYRCRRDWAEQLALEGHTTLRFDLPGTGDSAGDPADPGQLDSWTQSLSGAARWLLDAAEAERVVAIGIGLGGLVASRAALTGAPIDELVLWNVPGRGRTLVRELRAFSALEVAYIPDPGQAGREQPSQPFGEGALVANGYLLSPETVAQLEQLDLRELARPARVPSRALLLGRDGIKVDDALRETFEQAGTQVRIGDGPGYGEMILNPQEARPPTKVFQTVSSWISEPETPTVDGDASAKAGAHPIRAVKVPDAGVSSDQLTLVRDGVEIRETPISIEASEGPLFGILAEPVGEQRGLSAVLMNAGPQRRTGPNRMWVEIARRWAALGVPTLRLDVAGVGDSAGDSTRLVRVSSLYSKEYVGQARSALDLLAALGFPQRTLMLGLCSGAYWSMHAALQDERITSVVMLNPRTLIWDEWVYAVRRTRELRQQLLLGSTWRKLVTGDITLARHLETARALADRASSAPARARRRMTRSHAPAEQGSGVAKERIDGLLDALRNRDQRALMIFTGKEPLHRDFVQKGVFDRAQSWPNLRLETLGTSADTHTLSPPWLQRQVHDLVDEMLQQELRLIPAP
jgi:pimeloyl-ACP methyl ester carboxylesterase